MSWPRYLSGAALAAVLAALYLALVQAPTDVMLGDSQRIFYFHVAIALNGYLAFAIVLVGSILYLWTGRSFWDRLAYAAGEIGVIFATLILVTGSIWGRSAWSTWWTWDPRITTSLIMWFMYLGYLLIRSAAEGEERKARFAAVFGIIAFVMVPVVHKSVTWWRSIHPIVLDRDQAALDPRMVPALLVSLMAFALLHGYLLYLRTGLETSRDEVAQLRDRLMEGGRSQ